LARGYFNVVSARECFPTVKPTKIEEYPEKHARRILRAVFSLLYSFSKAGILGDLLRKIVYN